MSDIEQGPVDFRRVDIPAFIKRLVRYYEVNGNGDWRYAAETIEQQHGEIERLRARVAELEAAQAWRPIESAPKDGTHVLARDVPLGIRITNLTHPPMVVHWFDYIGDASLSGWYLSHGAGDGPAVSPTYWLPLPAPPKVAK